MRKLHKKSKLVHGVGINDADYLAQPKINGRQVVCPFYRAWNNMIERCYSRKRQEKHPTYMGCTVCKEWLTFSNFKVWMEKQDWEGKHLDKDVLTQGNKVYGPDNCVFVSRQLNNFLTDSGAARGDYLIGCYWSKRDNKFRAQCRNPFTLKREPLGYFTSEQEAHQSWRRRKHELACQYADMQTDKRVSDALRIRFL